MVGDGEWQLRHSWGQVDLAKFMNVHVSCFIESAMVALRGQDWSDIHVTSVGSLARDLCDKRSSVFACCFLLASCTTGPIGDFIQQLAWSHPRPLWSLHVGARSLFVGRSHRAPSI